MIPKGVYCYDENGICPHFTNKKVGSVSIPFCNHLQEGSIGDITDEEYNELKTLHKVDDDEIYKIYPLDLLWDQVKECGENEEQI